MSLSGYLLQMSVLNKSISIFNYTNLITVLKIFKIATMELRQSPSQRYIRYEAQRLRKVNATAIVFLTFGLLQLAGFRFIKTQEKHSLLVPGFMWVLIIIICLCLIVYAELYDKFPVNWTLALVVVESSTMSVMGFIWLRLSQQEAWVSVVIATIINLIIHTLSLYLPLESLPGYQISLTLTFVYVLSFMCSSIINCVLRLSILYYIVDFISLGYNCLLMLYAGTLIRNRRHTNIMSREYILSAAFIAYFYFNSIQLVSSIVYDVIEESSK